MPDLADGESVEIQGSAAKPYVLKNVGGVYSCTCPAWRNQSIGIERRTCKHLRKYRGDAAEEARLGGALPAKPVKKAAAGDDAENAAAAPPLLLAESWDNALDLSGWWMSEKLDGVRAFWDGRQFLSRQGNLYHAPDWFVEGLPNVPLDGELWIDRKAFQRTVSIVRRQDKSDHWKTVRYLVFDAPAVTGPFEERIGFLKDGVRAWRNSFVTIHEHSLCRDVSHLRDELQRIEALGGEGLMLRQPGSKYASGRSATLLKVKTFHDAEAEVIRHEPGKGRHKGRLGALTVRLPNGKEFSVGTGFSDKQRENPPALGSLIQFRYQELSDAGIPRFPSYVGLRSDITASDGVARPESSKGVVSSQLAQRPRPSKTQGVPPAASVVKPTAAKSPSTRTTRGQAPQNSELAECSPDSAWRSIPPILNSAVPDPGPPVSSAPRRFEFIEGSSSKFWEVSIDGSDVTTRWGRIGSDGQSKTKSFATPDKARAEYDKLVDEKVGKGYKEVVTTAGTPDSAEGNQSADELDNETDESPTPLPSKRSQKSTLATATPASRSTASAAGASSGRGQAPQNSELADLSVESGQRRTPPILNSAVPDPGPPAPSAPRYFEFVEGSSSKFWEVSIDGTDVTTRWGRIGSDGQSKTKSFATSDKAQAEYDKLVEEKVGKGYKEIASTGNTADSDVDGVLGDEASSQTQSSPVCTAAKHVEEIQKPATGPSEGVNNPFWAPEIEQVRSRIRELSQALGDLEYEDEPGDDDEPESTIEPSGTPTQVHVEPTDTSIVAKTREIQPVSKETEDKVWAFARYQASLLGFRALAPSDIATSDAELLRLDPVSQIEVLKACFRLRKAITKEFKDDIVEDLRERLLRRKLPYTSEDIEFLAAELKLHEKTLLGVIERYAKDHPLADKVRDVLRGVRDRVRNLPENANWKRRIDVLVGDDAVRIPILPKEVWAATAIADLQCIPAEQRVAWTKLIQHCVSATTAKPSAAWVKSVEPLISTVTQQELLKYAKRWFPLLDKPWTEPRYGAQYLDDPLSIAETNQDILRGLVWCCSLSHDPDAARTVGATAISAYRKIPRIGARAVRVGNASVFALGVMHSLDAVAQLAILKVKVKNGTAQKLIEKELDAAATRMGLPREELEEMSVPAYGLDDIGVRRESIGDYTAELVVAASGSTELRWIKSDGSPQKSVPAAVQKEFGEELKEFKAAAKDIQKMVPVQRERIDGLFLQQKSWPFPAWRERYLDHPLVGIIARRLIWRFRTGDTVAVGIFHDGQIVGHDATPLRKLGDETTVELWHPIGQPVDEIMAWRTWLERHEVQQPFKQAHREVYLLTDAERATGIYSNRFAAHVLRQTRLRALASMRGWHCSLLGEWDSGGETAVTRHVSRWGLSAQFWINAIYGDTPAGDDDFAGSPGVPYISTDQVRFYFEANQQEPIPLADVPPLVFSEILRDVDLFVGVASVGNDPTWADGGPGGHHLDYWQTYSFGELSASAHTRHDVLERLVPRLKIADRCSLTDRFLVVRGDIRTYKIHLGSGNILMSPNDQYLCIVPKQAAAAGDKARVFLPFEGDNTLSVILSKAFLLAEDTKIKDATITSQIRRG